MAKKGGYSISEIYQGGSSGFKPYNTKQLFSAGSLATTTDPRTANILQDVSTKLSGGLKHIEIAGVSSELFDSIPKQQLKEVNRLSKLTGTNISVHGPVIDTTGISQQGFSELDRDASERKIVEALNRSNELDPGGNISVNFHSGEGIPGSQFIPPSKRKPGEQAAKLIVVNQDTGKLAPLEAEKLYYPEMERLKPEFIEGIKSGTITKEHLQQQPEKYYEDISLQQGKVLTPERRVGVLNHTEWDNAISQLIFNKERADEILETNKMKILPFAERIAKGEIDPKDLLESQKPIYRHLKNAEAYLEDLRTQLYSKFSKAYEYGTPDQRNELEKLSQQFKETLAKDKNNVYVYSEAMNELLQGLKRPDLAPQMYVPIEEFAVKQSSKTFGNAAFASYKKFGEKAPVVNIENPPAGFALSTGEDIKNIVEASRKQFVQRAMKEDGLNEKQAKEMASKLIGATWDLGHINMLRKFGYNDQEIIEEAKKVAPYIKHIHLSDNFGYEHTELPMGMGNVNTKEVMEALGEKAQKATKVIEAAQWFQHFKTSPFQYTLEGMGSPVYNTGVAPYWNQAIGFQQDYFGGSGLMLPQINYETFGAGFSQLPSELGGQRPGAQGSRISGRPME